MNDFRDYVAHHGIKGQKWGVKNGPPYPLDASDHNARERKANWRSSLGRGDEVKKKKVTVKKAEIHKNKKAGGFFDDLKAKKEEEKKKQEEAQARRDAYAKYRRNPSNYTKEFLNSIKKDIGPGTKNDPFAQVDDDDLIDLLAEEYEENTGKTPYQKEFKYEPKNNNGHTNSTSNQKAGGMLDFLKKKDKDDKGNTSIDDLNKMLLNSNASALKEWQNKKAGGMLDFLKKSKDKDKENNQSSIDDLNKMFLNNNASSLDAWKNISKQKAGSFTNDGYVDAGRDSISKEILSSPLLHLGAALALDTIGKVSQKNADRREDIEFEKFKSNSEVKTVDELPKRDSNSVYSVEEAVKDNNPGYPKTGRTMNCVLCTTAMAMREKGYDVQAKASKDPWATEHVMKKMFKNAKHYDVKSMSSKKGIQKAENLIKSFGDGAYGNICVYWPIGGGHSMFFKNVNGKVNIYDSQSGITYSLKDFEDIALGTTYITRLDTAIPTDNVTAFVEPRSK